LTCIGSKAFFFLFFSQINHNSSSCSNSLFILFFIM
jgi:hypothetical protein